MKIGVLALQGDFEAHRKALASAGAEPVLVRTAAGLAEVDGLVLPGGESTTMLNLLRREKLFEPLREFGARKPVLDVCRGDFAGQRSDPSPAGEPGAHGSDRGTQRVWAPGG